MTCPRANPTCTWTTGHAGSASKNQTTHHSSLRLYLANRKCTVSHPPPPPFPNSTNIEMMYCFYLYNIMTCPRANPTCTWTTGHAGSASKNQTTHQSIPEIIFGQQEMHSQPPPPPPPPFPNSTNIEMMYCFYLYNIMTHPRANPTCTKIY